MYGFKPNVSFVKIFGCKGFSYIEERFRRKLDHTAQGGTFLGFSNNSITFRKQVRRFQTRNAKFHEDVIFCKAKIDRYQHSHSEDPSVAHINLGDVSDKLLQ